MAAAEDYIYKLTYFNFKGIAEPIRFIFKYSQVPFEDVRLEWDEKWTDELKHTFAYGTLPTLTVGDFQLSESVAICRFLANKFGLAGKDEFESAKCDELVDKIVELRSEWVNIFMEMDEVKKAAMKEAFSSKLCERYSTLSGILDKNGGSFFVGNALTWTDLYLAYFFEYFMNDVNVSFPSLQQFQAQVFELPAIKSWIDSRPASLA